MDTDQFLQSVEPLAGLYRESARRAPRATLATLGERVGRPVATELVGGLPGELGAALTGGPDAAEPFDAEAFARRTAVREDVDRAQGATMPGRSWPLSARTYPASRSSATGCRPTIGRCSASHLP
jgi:uncharacterized protein (DUF2267 family)